MTEAGAPPVLVARSLAIAPPGAPSPLLRNLSFELAPGDWIALTGANGSGKTTLALVLGGLRRPAGGTVEIDGWADPDRLRGAVAVVLQEPETQLLQSTVHDELAFTSRNLGRPEADLEGAVLRRARALGLEEDLDRDPRMLSAGRQQLVALAAALVHGPRALILDEVGAFLDAESRLRVIGHLRHEVEAGLILFWITQEPEEIAAAARVWTLEGGCSDDRDTPVLSTADPVLGSSGGGRPPTLTPPSGRIARLPADTAPLARLRVRPWNREVGPRIAVAGPLEIAIPERGVVGILGRNGAGKSALLAAASGASSLPQVEMVWAAPPRHPAILAGQYPELQIFEERAEDEAVFTAVSRGVARSTALGAARLVLAPLGRRGRRILSQRSHELSAGEKRILQVVGALIAPAAIRALDEPTAGLDPEARDWLAATIKESASRGPLLIASQDVPWIDRVGAVPIALGWSGSAVDASISQKTD